jgi:aspartate-semialdehyde dehydrogenase
VDFKVLKFGGSILKDRADFERVADIVAMELERSNFPIPVVSAIRRATDRLVEAIESYVSEPQGLGLPSSPEKPVLLLEGEDMPQPRLHRDHGYMVTLAGRLQRNPLYENGFTYIVTSDNLEKGAGAGAVNSAKFLRANGYL